MRPGDGDSFLKRAPMGSSHMLVSDGAAPSIWLIAVGELSGQIEVFADRMDCVCEVVGDAGLPVGYRKLLKLG
jgi:hypothetical protein